MVTVRPNTSGLQCGEFVFKPAHNLLGPSWDGFTGKPTPPDVPPGVFASVKRTNSVKVKGSRYLITASGSLAVVSVENQRKYTTRYSDEVKELAALRAALMAGDVRALCTAKGGNEIPWMNARRCFHAKARIEQFGWGRAVMFLTTYVQGPTATTPVNNDMLVLTVQGLTSDGRYAVNGHFDIRHPRLPDTMDDRKAAGRRIFSLKDQEAAAEAWLDRQPDDSFQPGIAQYTALLAAIDIKFAP